MKMRISVSACRRALSITSWTRAGGIPLTLDGEEKVITQVEVRGGHWYSGDRRLTRPQQEELTRRAKGIIEQDRKAFQERFPRLPPRMSIRECQEAIRIEGGILMPLRGEERPEGGSGVDRRCQSTWISIAFGLASSALARCT